MDYNWRVLNQWKLFLFILAVGCDGVVGSAARLDHCGVCAGNNTSCHLISGIFTRAGAQLPYGYNKVTVIPRGACNVNITEMVNTNNYLVLKESSGDYILNGNWALSYSHEYAGAGTVWKYHRGGGTEADPREYVLADGPTNASVDIMLIKQVENRGVMYSYTIPTAAADEHHRHRSKKHRLHRHRHDNEVPQALQKAEDADDTNTITHKEEPQKLDDKETVTEDHSSDLAVDLDRPQGDQQQPKAGGYQEYLLTQRRRQEEQRRLRSEQRRRILEERRRRREKQEKEREEEIKRREQLLAERKAEDERRIEYQKQTGFQPGQSRSSSSVRQSQGSSASANQISHSSSQSQRSSASANQISPSTSQSQRRVAVSSDTYRRQGNYYQPLKQAATVQGPQPLQPPPQQLGGLTQSQLAQRQRLYQQHRQRLQQQQSSYPGYPIPQSGAGYPIPSSGSANKKPSVGTASAGNTISGAGLPGVQKAVAGNQVRLAPQPVQPGARGQTIISAYKPGYQPSAAGYRPNGIYQPNAQYQPNGYQPNTAFQPGAGGVYPAVGPGSAQYPAVQYSAATGRGTSQVVLPQQQSAGNQYAALAAAPRGTYIAGQGFSGTSAALGGLPGGVYTPQQAALLRTQNDRVSQQLAASRQSGVVLGALYDAGNANYAWKISGFTECSATCGGGTQDTVVVCVKADSQAVVTDENCANAIKPAIQAVSCNNLACPPGWEGGEWGDCSTSCDTGVQTRTVSCKQKLSATLSFAVTENECAGQPKIPDRQRCNDDNPCVKWKIGEWGRCSAECGRGQRSREVACVNVEGRVMAENMCQGSRPRTVEICDMGSCAKTWFFTKWSEECSTECGDGHYTRNVHCSAEADRCHAITRPANTSPCKNDLPCGGQWFTGPWNKCNAVCGVGVRERDVVCMKKLGRLNAVVGDENCLILEKPITQKPCEKAPCQPEWYMTEWAECSRTCGGGIATREVKCLDQQQRPSHLCPDDDKPDTRQACNTRHCPRQHGGGSRGMQAEQSTGCTDSFQNCRLVVQARLCRYDYYKNICCFSCSGYQGDNSHNSINKQR